jgi:hypothetical protein
MDTDTKKEQIIFGSGQERQSAFRRVFCEARFLAIRRKSGGAPPQSKTRRDEAMLDLKSVERTSLIVFPHQR